MEAEFEIRHLLKAINHQVEQYTKSYLE